MFYFSSHLLRGTITHSPHLSHTEFVATFLYESQHSENRWGGGGGQIETETEMEREIMEGSNSSSWWPDRKAIPGSFKNKKQKKEFLFCFVF